MIWRWYDDLAVHECVGVDESCLICGDPASHKITRTRFLFATGGEPVVTWWACQECVDAGPLPMVWRMALLQSDRRRSMEYHVKDYKHKSGR